VLIEIEIRCHVAAAIPIGKSLTVATDCDAAISGELTMVAEWTKRISADEMRNKEEKEVSGNSTRIAMDNAPNSRTIGSCPAFRRQASFGPVKWLRIGKIRENQS
jgi:hypothetical protein